MIKIIAASIQMESINNDIEKNIEKATALIEKAVSQGAEIILLPEFSIIWI